MLNNYTHVHVHVDGDQIAYYYAYMMLNIIRELKIAVYTTNVEQVVTSRVKTLT